jgi:hypothetical protein
MERCIPIGARQHAARAVERANRQRKGEIKLQREKEKGGQEFSDRSEKGDRIPKAANEYQTGKARGKATDRSKAVAGNRDVQERRKSDANKIQRRDERKGWGKNRGEGHELEVSRQRTSDTEEKEKRKNETTELENPYSRNKAKKWCKTGDKDVQRKETSNSIRTVLERWMGARKPKFKENIHGTGDTAQEKGKVWKQGGIGQFFKRRTEDIP